MLGGCGDSAETEQARPPDPPAKTGPVEAPAAPPPAPAEPAAEDEAFEPPTEKRPGDPETETAGKPVEPVEDDSEPVELPPEPPGEDAEPPGVPEPLPGPLSLAGYAEWCEALAEQGPAAFGEADTLGELYRQAAMEYSSIRPPAVLAEFHEAQRGFAEELAETFEAEYAAGLNDDEIAAKGDALATPALVEAYGRVEAAEEALPAAARAALDEAGCLQGGAQPPAAAVREGTEDSLAD